jgi:hypothetical protein
MIITEFSGTELGLWPALDDLLSFDLKLTFFIIAVVNMSVLSSSKEMKGYRVAEKVGGRDSCQDSWIQAGY